jgi:nitrate/nitrite-specific signal transduction histidine kinase
MDRRTALSFLAGLTAVGAPVVIAQVASVTDAINKAGHQRMLSQRMSKAYLALGLEIAAQKAQEVINESMAKFDRQLVELSAFAPRADIKATYAQLGVVWGQYKTVLVGQAPRRESVAALVDLDGKVLELAHQGVTQLEQLSGKSLGRLVNVAGRQRMLSQRAAKFYLTQAWKAQLPQADAELQKARAEFASGLKALEQAPEATPAIRQELELARQQWVFFELALAYQGNASRSIENVFVLSENVLSVMEKVTVMYARQTAA